MLVADFPSTPAAWHQRIWHLTWPIILANVTIPLVGVADVAVMGRLSDPAYIASVAMGAAMFSAVYWLFGFLRMGTTGLTAQAFGAAKPTEARAVFKRAVGIAGMLGLVIVLLQWPLSQLLFALFDANLRLTGLVEIYFDIRIFGAPALLIYLVALGVLFGLQRMRDTLWLSISLNLTNLVLDVVLVLGFDLGVAGVAIGTLISEIGAAVAGCWLVNRALRNLGGARPSRDQLWRKSAIRALFYVSGNLIIRTFFVQLPFFVGTVAATALGELTLAAHAVLMQLFFIMTYTLDGFAHTAETLAGYAFGGKNAQALRKTTLYSAGWALGLALMTAVVYWMAGAAFISWLTVNEAVRSTATDYLPWIVLSPLTCIAAFLLDGIFIGTTHIREMRNAMFASASLWALLLGLSYSALGYHAIWFTMSIFMLTRGLLLALYYPRIERAASGPADRAILE